MTLENLLPLIMRWIHILTAIVAVGGSFFLRVVLMPAASAVLSREEHNKLRPVLLRRWQKVVHVCIALFLLSGLYNYLAVTRHLHEGQPLYHALFGVKFLLALGIFTLAVLLTSLKPYTERLRTNSRFWLSLLLTLAFLVVLISGYMKQIPPI